jgi:hypothetical protein
VHLVPVLPGPMYPMFGTSVPSATGATGQPGILKIWASCLVKPSWYRKPGSKAPFCQYLTHPVSGTHVPVLSRAPLGGDGAKPPPERTRGSVPRAPVAGYHCTQDPPQPYPFPRGLYPVGTSHRAVVPAGRQVPGTAPMDLDRST